MKKLATSMLLVGVLVAPMFAWADEGSKNTGQRWEEIIATATQYANRIEANDEGNDIVTNVGEGGSLIMIRQLITDLENLYSQLTDKPRSGQEPLIHAFHEKLHDLRWQFRQINPDYGNLRNIPATN